MTDTFNFFIMQSSKISSTASFDINSPSFAMYQLLTNLSIDNAKFFENDETEAGQRLHGAFAALRDQTGIVAPFVNDLKSAASRFDLDSEVKGNGYRSFVTVADMCVARGIKLSRAVCDGRGSLLFRKSHFVKEIEACSQVMASLGSCLSLLQSMASWSTNGELLLLDHNHIEEVLKHSEKINVYCFYGRFLGFQLCESMRKIMKSISVCLASFSESYYKCGKSGLFAKAANSVVRGYKYASDPELRACRVVNLAQYASVDFCKSFWLLSELEIMSFMSGIVCPSMAVNRVISIPPEPFDYVAEDCKRIPIPVPSSYFGPAAVNVRLLSAASREGMKVGEGKNKNGTRPPSTSLILHCHGGGFVAQSSRSHEVYLREWATTLDIPILSVDYSLAPRAPYPRALEEVFYVYCWVLQNSHLLGSTAERIILAGDSAGAILCICVTMKCIEMGIRIPDGLFLAYVPVLVSFAPSPSRLLSLMDPLLPFGFLINCLKAYALPQESLEGSLNTTFNSPTGNSPASSFINRGNSTQSQTVGSDTESFEEVSESDLLELAAHKSPLSSGATNTLTTVSLASLQSRPEADQVTPTNEDKPVASRGESETCMSDVLEKYVLDVETDSKGRKVPILKAETPSSEGDEQVIFDVSKDSGFATKLGKVVGSFTSGMSSTFDYITGKSSSASSDTMKCVDSGNPHHGSPIDFCMLDTPLQRNPSDIVQFEVPKDPFLSPYWATDDILKHFPSVSLLTTQMDPCLDDCVTFAKRLRNVGNPVSLDILEGLPHGFLNFSPISKEAHAGSLLCIRRIKDLLYQTNSQRPSPTETSDDVP